MESPESDLPLGAQPRELLEAIIGTALDAFIVIDAGSRVLA